MRLLSEIGPAANVDFKVKLLLASSFVVIGLACMIAGVMRFRKAETMIDPLNPEKANQLVVTGIYHLSRNPMYLGMAWIAVACGIYLANPWSLLGVVGFVLFINRFQITPEEKAMDKLFGIQFAQYKTSVRRWL